MFANLSDRWGVLMIVEILMNEIQNGLLFLREHAGLITEHLFGSQGLSFEEGKRGLSRGLRRLNSRNPWNPRLSPLSSHRDRRSCAGIGLLLAMLFLFLLSLLGGALLAVSTLELRIGDNYKTATGLLYLAEAGIEDGRDFLRTSTMTASQLLAAAAGGDGALADSRDPDVLLASGDTPLIGSRLLHSVSGQ